MLVSSFVRDVGGLEYMYTSPYVDVFIISYVSRVYIIYGLWLF